MQIIKIFFYLRACACVRVCAFQLLQKIHKTKAP